MKLQQTLEIKKTVTTMKNCIPANWKILKKQSPRHIHIQKLNQEDIKILNNNGEIEAVTKTIQTNKSPGPDEFTAKFYKTSKNIILQILLTLQLN